MLGTGGVMARTKPRRTPVELVDSSQGDDPMSIEALGGPSRLESVTYILAMTKPLVEIAKARNLPSLVYYLEMAMLESADLEHKLRLANPNGRARSSGPGSEQ